MDKKTMPKWWNKRIILLAVGILLILFGFSCHMFSRNAEPQFFGVIDEASLSRISYFDMPPGTLYITGERRDFQLGDMTLIIPTLDLETLIGDSTLPPGLAERPGLYEFSQLPRSGDVNVSIAGHRDIYGMEFMYLDRVRDGDYLYVIHRDWVFRYIYEDTHITHAEDWSVIRPQGFSVLTLTTCDPIGTTLNRLILRARLVDYSLFDEDFVFHMRRAI